ncbi:MAG: pilus assembly protein [Syntrophobacteraceae bacterium]
MISSLKQQPVKVIRLWPLIVAATLFLAASTPTWCSASKNTMASYTATPPFVSVTEKPAVMLIFDNSGSMHGFAFQEREVRYIYSSESCSTTNKPAAMGFVPATTYYGYFDPNLYYIYDGTNNYFSASTSGDWNGNFLNWLFMKRSDVAKKVMTGGKTGTVSGSTVLMTDRTDGSSGRGRWKLYDDTNPVTDLNGASKHMSPYHDKWVMQYENTTGATPVTDPARAIIYKVQSISNAGTSTECWKQAGSNFSGARTFTNPYLVRVKVDSTPRGVVQDSGDKIRFGLTLYDKDGDTDNGGKIDQPIGTATSTIVSGINAVYPATWTPLAETLYTVMNYFQRKQYYYESDENGYLFPDSGANQTANNARDPFYFNDLGKFIPCSKAFVILITDGESTMDQNVPNPYKDYVSSSHVTYASNGTDYLKGVAYYAHKNDLRSDLEGIQNLTVYTVLAFGSGSDLLKETARYGGYVDVDLNGAPNSATAEAGASANLKEWDFNGDGSPDNYATASSGQDLENAILNAINSILARVSSATAASVISNTRSGEGAVYQAVFYPLFEDSSLNKTAWAGEVHALLLDHHGNMREDTNSNAVLDMIDDLVISYQVLADGTTLVRRYKDANGNGILESTETATPFSTTNIMGIKYLWNTSNWLNEITDSDVVTQRTYASADRKRYIFTSIDANRDGIPDSTLDFTCSADPSWSDLQNTSKIFPYLHTHTPYTSPVSMGSPWIIQSADVQAFKRRQTRRLIEYIRGKDQAQDTSVGTSTIPAFRTRKADYTGGTGTAKTWRLGDIVHSTPTVVTTPAENFDLLYRDSSYEAFYRRYKNRRTIVYAGANDGMIHAFNGGFYKKSNKSFVKKLSTEVEHDLGSELWAYVPFSLLPHLYWLTDPNYSHIYYVDLKPRIFDARIFADDGPLGTHPGGWGTVLVGGMRLGGGVINADTNKDDSTTGDPITRPSYFVLDITNPEAPPTVLAEFSFPELGFTTCYPTVLLTTDKNEFNDILSQNWHLVFGSGPIDENEGAGSAALSSFTSTKSGKIYMVNLKEIANPATSASITTIRSDGTSAQASFATSGAYFVELDDYTMISDLVAVDFDLSYSADAIYFGTIKGTYNTKWTASTAYALGTSVRPPTANGYAYICTQAGTSGSSAPSWSTTVGATVNDSSVKWKVLTDRWGGKLRRLVFDDGKETTDSTKLIKPLLPSTYVKDNILIDLDAVYNGQPIMATPSLAKDDTGRFWVFFGTGRFFTRDDAVGTRAADKQSFYGIKEPITSTTPHLLTWDTVLLNDLVNVTNAKVYETGATVSGVTAIGDFDTLVSTVEGAKGWAMEFPGTGERNLGQAAVFGDIVTFTTYIPSSDHCTYEGTSNLYGLYYKTGTAYKTSVLGLDSSDQSGGKSKVLKSISLGRGLSVTPNLSTGKGDGSTAFVQQSTGGIQDIKQANPGIVKSGFLSWEQEE